MRTFKEYICENFYRFLVIDPEGGEGTRYVEAPSLGVALSRIRDMDCEPVEHEIVPREEYIRATREPEEDLSNALQEAVEDELENETIKRFSVALHPRTINWREHKDTIGDEVRLWYFDDYDDALWFADNGVKQFAKQLGLEFFHVYVHDGKWTIASRNGRVALDDVPVQR